VCCQVEVSMNGRSLVQESYRLWRHYVWFRTINNVAALVHVGLLRQTKKKYNWITETLQKEVTVTHSRAVRRFLSGKDEENHERTQSPYLFLIRYKKKFGAFRIRSMSNNEEKMRYNLEIIFLNFQRPPRCHRLRSQSFGNMKLQLYRELPQLQVKSAGTAGWNLPSVWCGEHNLNLLYSPFLTPLPVYACMQTCCVNTGHYIRLWMHLQWNNISSSVGIESEKWNVFSRICYCGPKTGDYWCRVRYSLVRVLL
jgi:hypothetical protein